VQGSSVLLPHQNLRLQVLLEASPLAHSFRRMAEGTVPQSKPYAAAQSDSPWSDQFWWRFPISIRLLAERSVTALQPRGWVEKPRNGAFHRAEVAEE
jgi:hypothetical protein